MSFACTHLIGFGAAVPETGGAWTPASLGSALLIWWDFSDLSTMFTDTAGTTPVASSGDLIARINNKASGGYNPIQATSGNRPAYNLASGVHSASFDGVNDYLSHAAAPMWNSGLALNVFAAVILTNADPADSASILGEFNSGDNGPFYIPLTANLAVTDKGISFNQREGFSGDTSIRVLGATKEVYDGSPHVVGVQDTLSAITQRIDGVAYNAATARSNNSRTLNIVSMGAWTRSGVTGYLSGRIQQIVVTTGTLSGGDRASLEQFLAAKNGATV